MVSKDGARKDVLIIEDSASMRRIYGEYLAKECLDIDSVGTLAEARQRLTLFEYRSILLDLQLPDGNGFEILKQVEESSANTPVVILTAHGTIDIAVEAMRLGAYDFLEKPFNAKRLKSTVHSCLAQFSRLDRQPNNTQTAFRDQYFGFIGSSAPMLAVYDLIERAAPSKASVFITGESGTGKELCAQALHLQSSRREGPLITLNCAAIPKDLIESEIFGHLKGSFTGATSNRDGAATLADGGTLFLDEICEMPLDLQSKLLRFIQSGVIQKVGSNKDEAVDVRFVCATNRDPVREVEEGRFREDLYYRLYVIPIELPSLRDRAEDALLIATQFLRKFSREEGKTFQGFSADVERIILAYNWPGNVRQLQNIIRNIVVLAPADKVIERDDLPPPLNSIEPSEPRPNLGSDAISSVAQGSPIEPQSEQVTESVAREESFLVSAPELIRPLAEVERKLIEHAIALCEDNVPRAAGYLGVSPSTLYRKLQSWDAD